MRDEIIALLARLQQSKEPNPQEEHNLREITADKIIAMFTNFLPPPVDIDAKYELNGQPISLTIDTENRSIEQNLQHVSHIARYADDQGYNRYRNNLLVDLQELYKV